MLQKGKDLMGDNVLAKGLDGVVVGDTVLSKVDGEKGELIYYGYDIDEVAGLTFEEVAYLFLHGELPDHPQSKSISLELKKRYELPQEIISYLCQKSRLEHPMASLRTAISMLSAHRHEPSNNNQDELKDCALDLIAKTGTIVSIIARVRGKEQPLAPDQSMSYAKNFLYMCTGKIPDEKMLKTMDTAFILHMDHGFNASTFTARVVMSSLSDMISAVVAAIGSLKGPLHGGANTAVMKMLMEIGSLDNVEPWLNNALLQKKKVMGFGHRVYKVLDPRAKHLKRMSKEWGERIEDNKWFLMSEKLEDLIHKKKGLNANVDFYSASTYYTMGMHPDIYTPIFAIARMVGWVAHCIEQLKDNRIMRPEANYVGPTGKRFLH